MIAFVLAGLVGVSVFLVISLLTLRDDVHLNDKLRRNDARLAAERWQVLQERHDAVIELIAQIAEAKAPPTEPKKPLRRPRPKSK